MEDKKNQDFLNIAAHEMRRPVDSAESLVKTLLGEYAGPLSEKQKALLSRADIRLQETGTIVERMLRIARAGSDEGGSVDVEKFLLKSEERYTSWASEKHIHLQSKITGESLYAAISEELLSELLDTVVGNAIKYTPAQGHVEIAVSAEHDANSIHLTVSDSGPGIPADQREIIFMPFSRGASAKDSTVRGLGLGLTYARTIAESSGGTIRADVSDWGGAHIAIDIPAAKEAEEARTETAEEDEHKFHVVIIGGITAGPKTAARIIRLHPDAAVTVIEKDEFLSYAGCGLPYYISGMVDNFTELMSTPVGTARTPVFFHHVKHITIRSRTEATAIDRKNKRVAIRDCTTGKRDSIPYDKLALCTGATPIMPAVEGAELRGVFKLHGVKDAEGIRQHLTGRKALDVVIIGGGLIGTEITEALVRAGCRVTVVEKEQQILTMLDPDMARLVEAHMEANGVRVMTGTGVVRLEEDGNTPGHVGYVVTDQGRLKADMVIPAIGVRPNVNLAAEAGLDLGETTGAIRTDEHMMTSDPDIFAAGDCCESRNLITGTPCYVPLGSTANRQGRVAAANICGIDESFPGVTGSTACEVFDYCVAWTGLSEAGARAEGFDPVTAIVPAPDREHFMQSSKLLTLKLIVDRKSLKLLGAQAVGAGAGDKRIDVASMAITARMTVDRIANADLCYAPAFSPAMDNIITAANVVRNKLDGLMHAISAAELKRLMEQDEAFCLIDVRTVDERQGTYIPGSIHIPLNTLRRRTEEISSAMPIITYCNYSLRGYEAERILRGAGFENVGVLEGGMNNWPYETVTSAYGAVQT